MPETVARAVNLVAGEGVVVAVVPDEDDADRGELVCLESRDCSRRWSAEIDDPGPSPVRLNSALVAIGMLDRYELDSGEYEPLVCVLPELAHLVSWWMLLRAWVRSGGSGSAAVRVCPAMLMVMVR